MTKQAPSYLNRSDICELVVDCLADVLTGREIADVGVGPATHLIGRRSVLDSLGLVTLIVEVEDRLMSTYGLSVTIADDRAMSQTRSPFLTPQTLAEYIGAILSRAS